MELRRALLATALLLLPVAADAQQTQSTVNPNVPPVGFFVEQSGPQFRDNFQRVINDLNVLFARGGGGGSLTNIPAFNVLGNPTSSTALPVGTGIMPILNGVWGTPSAGWVPLATGSTTAAWTNAITTVNGQSCALAASCTVGVSLINGVAYPAAPSTNTVPVVTGSNTVTYEQVPNAALVNPSTTVNGQTCTLGGTCTISASAGSITVGTTSIIGGSTNQFLYDTGGTLGEVTKGNNCVYGTNGTGVPSCVTALPFIASLATGGTNASLTASNGGIIYSGASAFAVLAGTATPSLPLLSGTSAAPTWATISYPASATSGGIPYFSSTTGMASSAVLAAGAIVVGGGAGAAPSTTGCTINVNSTITCSSSTPFDPQIIVQNTSNDANPPFLIFEKSRSGGAVLGGDTIAFFDVAPFVNGSYQNQAAISWTAAGSPSGNVVPTKVQLLTSGAFSLSQSFTFDNNAHVLALATTNPTLTAGCNGVGSSVGTNSSDFAGNAVGQTAAATTCTVTFANAFATTPSCVVTGDQSQPTAITRSVSTLVLTFASTALYRFNWHCSGI
jgi:hypothetical protein